MALAGQVAVAATKQNNLIFSWAAVQSIADNTSTVSWQLLLEAKQYGKIVATPGSGWSVTVDGQTFSGTTSLAIGNNETKVLASGSKTVAHSADGSGGFSYSFSQDFWIVFDGENIGVISGSGSATLDTIARASMPTLSAPALAMGETLTIYTNRASSFTHTLEYSFGNASGVVAQGVGDNCTWTPPLELARQIPEAVSGTAVITCTTYSGPNPIGSRQVTVTLTVPESVVPTAEASWEDTSGAYGLLDSLVQNVSKLEVAVSGTGIYGSAITGASVTLNGKPYGGGCLTDSGELSLEAAVTDSRGRVGIKSLSITVAPYSAPSLTLSASRCTADGTADDAGDHARITVTGYVTQVNGSNTGGLVLTYGGTQVKASLGTGSVSYQTNPVEADPNATMAITAVLSDQLVSASRTMVLSTGYATLDLLAGGRGIAFGKAATKEGFECAMAAYFTGGINGVFESASYPGCAYRTVDGQREWLDPPMAVGTEYRTTERWKGKAVYTKAVSLGALPNNTVKTYNSLVSAYSELISFGVFSTNGTVVIQSTNVYWDKSISGLVITSTSNQSGYTATALLKYTK